MEKGIKQSLLPCIVAITALNLIVSGSCKCDSGTEDTVTGPTTTAHLPSIDDSLNVTILLDLSDRISKPASHGATQMEKDSSIVATISQLLVKAIQAKNIFGSGDLLRVVFEPIPNDFAKSMDSLKFDLRGDEKDPLTPKEKKLLTIRLRDGQLQKGLSPIYEKTLSNKNWIGCDVWSYMNNKACDLCVVDGYRNILVIVTDGFLFHVDSWGMTAPGEYRGISPQTLAIQQRITPVKANDNFANLEVLMLEVAPTKPNEYQKMDDLISDWFKGMGVKRFVMHGTDAPANTAKYISNFFEGK